VIADFVLDKMSSYIATGTKPQTAAEFTRGELSAVYMGDHQSRDSGGAWRITPQPEALSMAAAMAKCDNVIAEILKYCAEGARAKTAETAPTSRRAHGNALNGLRTFAKREWI
jgi:hypothetical protein